LSFPGFGIVEKSALRAALLRGRLVNYKIPERHTIQHSIGERVNETGSKVVPEMKEHLF
jgi:hypothetical protein